MTSVALIVDLSVSPFILISLASHVLQLLFGGCTLRITVSLVG